MNFSIDRPYAFLALLPIIPAVVFMTVRFCKTVKCFGVNESLDKRIYSLTKLKICFALKTVFLVIFYASAVCAFAEISWGTSYVPVKKQGNAVAFVFDVSYSMEANDCEGKLTRLEAVQQFSDRLLDNMENINVSVVLSKGEARLVCPLTEDLQTVKSIVSSLSPSLLDSTGTGLGNGIEEALKAFPEQSSNAASVWVFTDGEETNASLEKALLQSVRKGIPVTFIGFGSETGTEVFAGDRKTIVKSSLKSKEIRKMIADVEIKNNINRNSVAAKNSFISYTEPDAEKKLLSSVNNPDGQTVIYEIQKIVRTKLFILIAILSFIISYIVGELQITNQKRRQKGFIAFMIFTFTLTGLCGCSGKADSGLQMLQGKIEWNQKKYQEATSSFFTVLKDCEKNHNDEYMPYALYNLGTTYLMENENRAALERYSQIKDYDSEKIEFAVYYNHGIIAHRNGDYRTASECFKKALQIDSGNTNAKINYELSLKQETVHRDKAPSIQPEISEKGKQTDLETAIYSILKEKEQNKWKSSQQDYQSSPDDY